MHHLYIGTSGFSYPAWRGIFYPPGVPQKGWLTYYADRFNSLELNATFYRHFEKSVYESWHERTPPGFRFTIKAPREITHKKRLRGIASDLERFLASAAGLGDKLAVILWQFPASFRADSGMDAVRDLLAQLPDSFQYVFEFRHESWFGDDLLALLNQHHAGFVINDSSQYPAREHVTGNIFYLRLHGPDQLYDSAYNKAALAAWAGRIQPQLEQRDVFIYFNNTMQGQALENAVTLRDMLE